MTKSIISLLVADDHEVFLDGLKTLLNKQENMLVIGQAANGEELIAKYKELKPDVVITDIIMPQKDGIQASREIRKINNEAKIIALSMAGDDNYVVDMLEAGAMGYLLKNAGKQQIIDCIIPVNNNTHYFANHTSERLIQLIAKSQFNPRKKKLPLIWVSGWTRTKLIGQQNTSNAISAEVFLGIRTVEGYRQRIQDKMAA